MSADLPVSVDLPKCPLVIDRDAWIDALESLGIPVRDHHLMRIEADAFGMTVSYKRVNEKGQAIVGPERNLALATIQIGLIRADAGA